MFLSVSAAKPCVWPSPMKPFPERNLEEEVKAFARKIGQPCTTPRAVYLFITQKGFEPKWVRYGRYTVPRVTCGERGKNIATAVLTQKGFELKWVKGKNSHGDVSGTCRAQSAKKTTLIERLPVQPG